MEKDDLVGNSVEEIRSTIFSYLSATDLWSCLQISKGWRIGANVNSLWRRHCRDEGLIVDKCPPFQNQDLKHDGMQLCPAAERWVEFMSGPVLRWRWATEDQVRIAALDEPSTAPLVASSGQHLALFNSCQLSLEVFKGQWHTLTSVLPDEAPVDLSMFTDHIVLFMRHKIFIFQKSDNEFKFFKSLCLCSTLVPSKQCIYNSPNGSCFIKGNPLDVIGIIDNKLISVRFDDCQVTIKDLSTEEYQVFSVQPRFHIREFFSTLSYIFLHDGVGNLSVHNASGKQLFSLTNVEFECSELCANDEILCIFSAKLLTTYDVKRGGRLVGSFPVEFTTRVALCHPVRRLAFAVCYQSEDLRRVSALDPLCGATLWSRSLGFGLPSVGLVANRYLHVTNGDAWLLLDIADGTTLRQGTGNVKHISDYYSVIYDFDVKKLVIHYFGSKWKLEPSGKKTVGNMN